MYVCSEVTTEVTTEMTSEASTEVTTELTTEASSEATTEQTSIATTDFSTGMLVVQNIPYVDNKLYKQVARYVKFTTNNTSTAVGEIF